MRRIARLDRSIDLLRPRLSSQSSNPYLCAACKYQRTAFSTSTLRAARDKVPLTEKVRRKIWGTDQPPGQADPYGDASVLDRTKEREKRLDAEEAEEEAAAKRAAREPARSETILPDASYEPANTWDDLMQVGGKEEHLRETWDPYHQFHGFMPKEVLSSNEAISVALHRVVVETLALRQAEVPYEQMFRGAMPEDLTADVQVVLSSNGSPVLEFPGLVSQEEIVEAITAVQEEPVDEEIVEDEEFEENPALFEETSTKGNPTEAEEDVAADRSMEVPLAESSDRAALGKWNPAWLQVSLKDPAFKFAVIKRTLQLTGIKFPDAALMSTNDVQTLLSHIVRAPKPRKLSEALQMKEELLNLPNVSVLENRITSVDKEKAVGRWKVIEKELMERDLPVTGHHL